VRATSSLAFWIVLLAMLASACSAAPKAPSPQIIYVTAPPVAAPTPVMVYVTPVPTVARPSFDASESPTVAPTPTPSQAPITLKGTGTKRTAPFQLAGGDYLVAWKITAMSSSGCFYGGTLRGLTDVKIRERLGSHSIDSDPLSDTTYLYGIRAGRFYVDVVSGCDWTITLSR
jgi:hypothetical protein